MKKENERVIFVFHESIVRLLDMEKRAVNPIRDEELEDVLEKLYSAPGVGDLIKNGRISTMVDHETQFTIDKSLAEALLNFEYYGKKLGHIVDNEGIYRMEKC